MIKAKIMESALGQLRRARAPTEDNHIRSVILRTAASTANC